MKKQTRNELRMRNHSEFEFCILIVGMFFAFILGSVAYVLSFWLGILVFNIQMAITLFTIYDNRRYK